jgi:hypothetical protein
MKDEEDGDGETLAMDYVLPMSGPVGVLTVCTFEPGPHPGSDLVAVLWLWSTRMK